MNEELKNIFWSNFKITAKYVGVVFFILSAKIVFDSIQNDDNDGLFFPLLMLALSPVMLFGVYLYTKLKTSNLNKYLSAIIFGALTTVFLICLFVLSEVLNQQEINVEFVSFIALIFFVTLSLIYLQLPWTESA